VLREYWKGFSLRIAVSKYRELRSATHPASTASERRTVLLLGWV